MKSVMIITYAFQHASRRTSPAVPAAHHACAPMQHHAHVCGPVLVSACLVIHLSWTSVYSDLLHGPRHQGLPYAKAA